MAGSRHQVLLNVLQRGIVIGLQLLSLFLFIFALLEPTESHDEYEA